MVASSRPRSVFGFGPGLTGGVHDGKEAAVGNRGSRGSAARGGLGGRVGCGTKRTEQNQRWRYRIQRATESLKSFRPSVNSSFEEFKIDVSQEKDLLCNISFSKAVDVPKINENLSKVYNEALISWQHPDKNLLADSYVLEYKRHSQDQEVSWEGIEVLGTSKVVSDLETNSTYSFRVRGFKDAVGSLYSKEVTYHTPPAPVLSFLFDDKCGYNKERLILNKGRDSVESVAGTSLLLGAERIQVGSYMFLDYLIGDTGITKGRHFWAFSVESSTYLVKVGVTSDTKLQEWLHNPRDISSPRYDQDSGHDSGSEDACEDISQPFALATIGMNRLFIPKALNVFSDCEDRVIPMPSRIGIYLEYEKGLVGFYDANRMKCLYQRKVDCSGVMFPAFAMMGGGRIQLEQLISVKHLEYLDETQ